jgi:hypothetical protein
MYRYKKIIIVYCKKIKIIKFKKHINIICLRDVMVAMRVLGTRAVMRVGSSPTEGNFI